MRNSATSFSRSGLSDWIVQRVSAVILAVYFVVMVVIWAGHPSYACWHGLMMAPAMKILSLLSLLALASHAWVGLWTVLTDYVTTRHMGPRAVGVRLVLELAFALVIFVYLVWGIQILWG
ncbi:MAG: succinate dehydrogenase, hydrophobic membrane anchor protein [Pseudomonadales bacterium]|nr:succinate dehydrogenase, hydrophobic membrane anchor protein [Pseudomonadales bacterium]